MHRSMNLLAFVKKRKRKKKVRLTHLSDTSLTSIVCTDQREERKREGGDLTHIQWKLNHLFHSTSRQAFGLKREAREANVQRAIGHEAWDVFGFLGGKVVARVGGGGGGGVRLTVTPLPLSTFMRTSGGGEAEPTLALAS